MHETIALTSNPEAARVIIWTPITIQSRDTNNITSREKSISGTKCLIRQQLKSLNRPRTMTERAT